MKTYKEDQAKFNDCDIVIAPKELNKHPTFDKKYIDQILKIGYNSSIKALLENKNLLLNS